MVRLPGLGWNELIALYQAADWFVFPSLYEGFGLPVAEAMACACPVITCRISSLPEVGGEAVIYVDPDSIDQMHQALLEVQDAATRADLVARGRLQAERFSWSKMSREVGQSLATWATAPRRQTP